MKENLEAKYYKKALDFIKNENDPDTEIRFIGEYECYEVYEIVNDINPNETMISDYVLVNGDEVYKSYYHESVAIASKLKRTI